MSRVDHLAVYLSNRCNLACRYCYVAVNQAATSRLTIAQIRRAVDEFCDAVAPPDRKITFLGGEPLLDWSLFKDAARYARRRGGPDMILQTFTNATLLSPGKLETMRRLGVDCTVSLDGLKGDNDRDRIYRKAKDRSVYKDEIGRLALLDKRDLGVNLVFSAVNVERLLVNLEALREMGFDRIAFSPQLYEEWPDEKLRVMSRVLSGVARWYSALLDAGRAPQIQTLFAFLRNFNADVVGGCRQPDCYDMVLGPDARYYVCDKAMGFPAGQSAGFSVGGAEVGMDWSARRSRLDDLFNWIEKRGGSRDVSCPVGVVVHARLSGRDPGRALDSFRRVAAVFDAGLSELVSLCRAHPAFEERYGDAVRSIQCSIAASQ